MKRKWVLLSKIAIFILLSISTIACEEIEYEQINGTVTNIKHNSIEATLAPTFYYITVTFDDGKVRNFNDFYMDNFQIGKHYSLTIYQTRFSKPVWVIEEFK